MSNTNSTRHFVDDLNFDTICYNLNLRATLEKLDTLVNQIIDLSEKFRNTPDSEHNNVFHKEITLRVKYIETFAELPEDYQARLIKEFGASSFSSKISRSLYRDLLNEHKNKEYQLLFN